MNNPDRPLWTSSFILVALINLATFMAFNMTNTSMPVFVDMLGGSPFQIGLVTTLTTGAALITRPFTGLMVDRFGRKGILSAGLIVTTVSMALFAIIPIVPAILALRFIQGLGWGLSSTATSTIVADVLPPRRFAEGMGYFSLTTSITAAIAPALSLVLLEQIGIEVTIAVAIMCTLIACALTFASRFSNPPTASKPSANTNPEKRSTLSLETLFDRTALAPSIMSCLVNIAFTPITTFIVMHSQQQHVEGIFVYFIVYALVNIFTRPLIGKLVDRAGFFWPGIIACGGVALTLIIVAFANSLWLFCLAGALAGLGFGTAMSVFQTMAVGSVPPARKGVATSTYLFGANGGMAIGSLIAGIVAGPLGYGIMYLLMAIFPVLAGIAIIGMGPARLSRYRPH